MVMASGIYGPFVRDMGTNAKAFALNASDAFRVMLLADAHTPNFNTHDEQADLTNEVTGTGWSAGGVTLGSPTYTISGGFATFDGTDISQATVTVTGVRGCAIVDDTLAGDPLTAGITFGSDFATVAGTFAITWHANGIWRVQYV